ncbi:CtsR family transcriptional regulator [Selenihalanaerobacter shriftii]|uniref:Transcriptional regulator CtsR n=1 Tax=Selenihalanaerobacter shriftii TaxID=142842 RepID=A0A1T4QCS3_9FIRM|nr:CtsR family transcriptional regulator [Selenihalanaerobacter shriftii]SKA01321.1 transcriptional regulator CtsR [Selenihalanaerobacter shriftii]
MGNLSEEIEYYLKKRLAKNNDTKSIIKIQRNKIAKEFNCVPSQINYVLKTRFNMENGYIVESQRGGGGYIKITKVEHGSKLETLKLMRNQLGKGISQRKTLNILQRLYEEEIITKREKELLEAIIHRRSLNIDLPGRDVLRARILRSTLDVLAK